jgi:hypothetical protein
MIRQTAPSSCKSRQIVTLTHGSTTIAINTTPITGGTTGRLLYDNSGTVGEAVAAL